MSEVSRLPLRHHLDRRAAGLADEGHGDPDNLLSTPALAEWLGVSTQWLEVGRSKGYGPPFCASVAKSGEVSQS
jgi:hypothetical protein